MKSHIHRRRLGAACGLATALGAAHAHAQVVRESSASTAAAIVMQPPAGAPLLDEVVVTARRRAETLEKVPVSVTALGAAQIQQRNVTTDADLQRTVPGLVVRQNFNANQIAYSIRGQTIDAFSGSRPAVISYVNDVQIPQGASSAYYDLESIQVLKGPQGTLFGRNATGGAVLLSTARPRDSFDGVISAGVGDYGLRQVQGAVDLPLVEDKLLLRVAGLDKSRDGYVHNDFTGQDLGKTIQSSARVTLLARPVEGLENLTTYQFSDIHGTNVGGSIYSAYACGSKNGSIPLVTTAACLYSPILDSVFGAPGAWNAFLAAHPGVPAGGILDALAQQKARGPWSTSLDEPQGYQVASSFLTNATTFRFNDDLSVKNIFGVSTQRTHMHTDLDGTAFPIEHNYNALTGESGIRFDTALVTEEFQVAGTAFSKRLNYILGAYYSSEANDNFQNFAAFDLTPILEPQNGTFAYKTQNQSYAVFLQGTYDLGDLMRLGDFKITAGARDTEDHNQIQQLSPSITFASLGPNEEKESANKPSWQFGLEYKPNANVLVYLNQRGSWRSGGFSGTAPGLPVVASQGGNLYLPETTEDVEGGAKIEGALFGRPARLNVAVYNQWISNVQRTIYTTVAGNLVSLTASVPDAEVRGLELDGEFAPLSWLRIGGSMAYTHARYTNGDVALFGQSFTFDSYADTPELTGDIYAQVFLPMSSDAGVASIRVDVYGQGTQFISNTGYSASPGTGLPGYGLVNLHADWNNVYGSRISLSAFANNLTNEEYYVGGFPEGTLLGFNSAVPGMPRMFGFSASAKF